MAKDRIIETLGERRLLLPRLIADALAANDRLKYRLTLLQSARAAADGAEGVPALRDERVACGVEASSLDRVVAGSSRGADGRYRVPGAAGIVHAALEDLSTMLAPLDAADSPGAGELRRRAEAISGAVGVDGDVLGVPELERLEIGPDSLHVLVMDAHRALNALQAQIATETIDGARTHDLQADDRRLVRAFMRGVHATERLKFDHPGLGTIATHAGPALVIQNDLGTTDAHVVVVRVAGRVATITYTDVHLARLLFFQNLLEGWSLSWEDTRSRSDRRMEGGLYHLASGRLEVAEEGELERFLEHLGSRLVFIIDWNRARKRLRRLVGRREAVALLQWAAEEGYGHMAFLRAGGDALVYDALEFAGGRASRAGESLRDILGLPSAVEYLRAVLRICAESLLAGRDVSLVQDEVRAELTGYLRTARQEIHALAMRHAELSVEIAESARTGLEAAIAGAPERARACARRARRAEHEADALVRDARAAAQRAPDLEALVAVVEAADDIADCAEEAAFYATLLPAGGPAGDVRVHVGRIASLVVEAGRAYLSATQLSEELRRGGPREDMDAFLQATHRAIALEHETDDAQRAVHEGLAAGSAGCDATLFVVVELTRSFEEAADALMHGAHLLREQALTRMVRSDSGVRRGASVAPDAAPPRAPVVSEHVYVIGEASGPIPGADEIGAKAHGLARLARAGVRVPDAVALRTSLWRGTRDDATLREVLAGAVDVLESQTGLRLGGDRRPLLLSVRSGAPVSMPGMLETVLDVGLCDRAVRGLIAATGNPRLAWDSYRRLVESYATVVHDCPREPFSQAVDDRVARARVRSARELSTRALEELAHGHLERFAQLAGAPFPQDPAEQLLGSVRAVLASWDAPKAHEYRGLNGIPDDLGTAVIVQRMVFGNAGGLSGSGVGFTRDPALGEPRLYMDFLRDAQGEDVVSGRQTVDGAAELAAAAPELMAEIERLCPRLEAEFGEAQEFELTVQEGELFILQTRTAKRTPWAALRIAVDQVRDGLIDAATALARLDGLDLDAIRRVHVARDGAAPPLCGGVPASVGVASGPIALDRSAAERLAGAGTPPVLVRPDVVTDDVAALSLAAGLVTAVGGRTSHAAVVARELGKPCLVGCSGLQLDLGTRTARFGETMLAEGDIVCVDAESGLVFGGHPPVVEERPRAELAAVAAWREALPAGRG